MKFGVVIYSERQIRGKQRKGGIIRSAFVVGSVSSNLKFEVISLIDLFIFLLRR